MRTATIIIFICGSITGILIFRLIRRSGYDVPETLKESTGPISSSEFSSSSEVDDFPDKTPEELIEFFRRELDEIGDSNRKYRKEMLQFLCAQMIIKVSHEKAFILMNEELEKAEKYGSAYDREASDIRKRILKIEADPHEFAKSMAIMSVLLEEFDQSKVAKILNYFYEDEYFSVKEVLLREPEDKLITRALANDVNKFLESMVNTHVQWKWVNKERNTVFPLVTTDSCKVPHI